MSGQDENRRGDLNEDAPGSDDLEQAGDRGSADGETEAPRVEDELSAKAEEARRNWDLYVRERAELENFKKRMQREKAEALRYSNESLIRDLLPIIDNLERAVGHADEGGNGQPLLDGVRLVLKNALEVLERYGVKRLEVVGDTFDPARHEAVVRIPDSEHEPNQVVEQFLPGYTLHERLLRAAQVGVSAGATVENDGGDD